MPAQPLHPNCHCESKKVPQPIPGITAFAKCPIEKIRDYAFVDEGKKGFFKSAGYNVAQASQIQKAIEQQASKKYAAGEYILGDLTEHGQRITILIELSLYGEPSLIFLTGWMVYPYGN